MKNKALTLGLAVILYTFVLKQLSFILYAILPGRLTTLVTLVVSAAVAYWVAPRFAEDEPPPVISNALLVSAGVGALLIAWGGFGYPGLYLKRVEAWALAATVALTVRFLTPRAMLFIGITAFAMQIMLLGMIAGFIAGLSKWIGYLFHLGVAMAIAAILTRGEKSPEGHVKGVNPLWYFGAAGAVSMTLADQTPYLFSYRAAASLIWLAFLASFGWLFVNWDSGAETRREDNLGTRILVFLGLHLTVGSYFHLTETIVERLQYSTGGLSNWIPLFLSVLITLALMWWMRLSDRLTNQSPGRGLLKWGAGLYAISLVIGGGIFGSVGSDLSLQNLLPALAAFAIAALPLLVAAQILVGIGLLRMFFALGPRLR